MPVRRVNGCRGEIRAPVRIESPGVPRRDSVGFPPTSSLVLLDNDGVMTLFAALEARKAAAILADGIANVMPRSLVTRRSLKRGQAET